MINHWNTLKQSITGFSSVSVLILKEAKALISKATIFLLYQDMGEKDHIHASVIAGQDRLCFLK